MTSSYYHLSVALNPGFKLRCGARADATTIGDPRVDLCPDMHPNDQASETVSKRPRPSLFSFLDLTPPHCDSASKVASYLAEPVIELNSNPLMFWKNNSSRFPSLVKVSNKFLCLPAASAPVEQVFLKARNITRAVW